MAPSLILKGGSDKVKTDKRELATPFGRVDERVAEAIAAAMDEQTDASAGTRERAWRRAKEILAARHPGQQVPLPSRATVYRVISSLEGSRHTFGSAAGRANPYDVPPTARCCCSANWPAKGRCRTARPGHRLSFPADLHSCAC